MNNKIKYDPNGVGFAEMFMVDDEILMFIEQGNMDIKMVRKLIEETKNNV